MATLKIYQLKDTPDNRERRWLDYNSLGKLGERPDLANYDLVYQMPLRDNPTPEQVFQQFNLSRPADFTGHSLSVSDVIAYQSEDSAIAYYVDSASFVRLPELEEQLAFHLRDFEEKDMVYMANYTYGGQDMQSAVCSQGDTLYVMVGRPPHSERFRHDLTPDESAAFHVFEQAEKSTAVPLESTPQETINADAEIRKPVVGFLRYLDSNETVDYTDPEEYIAAYREALYTQGPMTVRATTLTPDLNVHYEIEKLLVGEFGEELPDKALWIAAHAGPEMAVHEMEDAPELE